MGKINNVIFILSLTIFFTSCLANYAEKDRNLVTIEGYKEAIESEDTYDILYSGSRLVGMADNFYRIDELNEISNSLYKTVDKYKDVDVRNIPTLKPPFYQTPLKFEYSRACTNLSKYFLMIGDHEKASQVISIGINFLPQINSIQAFSNAPHVYHRVYLDIIMQKIRLLKLQNRMDEYNSLLYEVYKSTKNIISASKKVKLGKSDFYGLYSYMSIISLLRNEYEEALFYNQKTIEATKTHLESMWILSLMGYSLETMKAIILSDLLLEKGYILLKMGRYTQAEKPTSQALKNIENLNIIKPNGAIGTSRPIWDYYFQMAKIYENLGNRDLSYKYYTKSIDFIENSRSKLIGDNSKVSYFSGKQDVYENFVDYLVYYQDFEEAFNIVERSRSRAFVDLLAGNVEISNDNKFYYEYNQILEIDSNLNQNKLKMIEQNRGLTISNYLKSKNVPKEVISLVSVNALSLSEIQKIIPDNLSIVEFYITNKSVHCWVLDTEKFTYQKLDIDPNSLNVLIEEYRSDLTLKKPFIHNSNRLYETLIKPIDNRLLDKMCIVPHKSFHLLPFQSLHDGKRYLVEKKFLFYIDSSTALTYCLNKQQEEDDEKVLLVGDPTLEEPFQQLPYALREVQSIKKKYKNALLLIGDAATETKVRNESRSAQIIHFACHGYYDSKSPLNSFLLLKKDANNDGLLMAKEVFSLNLKNTKLVNLSACETGIGKIIDGNEIIGLIRAFMTAGSKSVISSQWNINDLTTQMIMDKFYISYSNNSIVAALRNAQINLINDNVFNHPYFWAAFQLYGDYR